MDPVVILGSENVAVGPGQQLRLPVRVRNQGRRVESYIVDVVGAAAAFADVEPKTVSVLPGREAELAVTFCPPGGTSTPTGTTSFAVRATSDVDQSSSAVAEGRLEIQGVAGLQAWAVETVRSGRWKAVFHLEFVNEGNAAARLALTAHDPTAIVRLDLRPDVIDLVPGGRTTAQVHAKTRAPFLRGSPANRNIQVACQTFPFGAERPRPGAAPPQDDPNHRAFQLSFQQLPILPKFAIPLIVLAIGALIVFAIIKLRGDERPALTLAAPIAPTGLVATPGGPNEIALAWQPVANAEGYRVDQLSINRAANRKTLAEALPPDQPTYVATELMADTEYCFAVWAVGPNSMSTPKEGCQRTGALTRLPQPTGVKAAPLGGTRYSVTWDPLPNVTDDVKVQIYVDGQPAGEPALQTGGTIEVEPQDVEQTVEIRVQAIRGDEPPSPLSDVFTLPIPALAPSTTASAPATTGGGPPTTAAGVPATPTTAGATTTSAPTSSTTPPPAVSELRDLDPVVVAMLFAVNPPNQGGLPLDQVKVALSTKYNLPAELMSTFSNRDTLAEVPSGSPPLSFSKPSAGKRFIYVSQAAPGGPPLDETSAAAVCAPDPANCRVLHLVGAAASSEGKDIAILAVPPSDSTIADVDAMLDDLRDRLDTSSIHVLDGAAHELLKNPGPVIYASGFASEQEAVQFCVDKGSQVDSCTVRPLPPAD
jgi:hypothetical protein